LNLLLDPYHPKNSLPMIFTPRPIINDTGKFSVWKYHEVISGLVQSISRTSRTLTFPTTT
jgi:hypothetical protein